MLLTLKEFNLKYPNCEIIGKGNAGIVYRSGNHAIKKQWWSTQSFFTEYCILSQFQHPNICSMEDIIFHGGYAYMSLPLGETLFSAYYSKKISLREIITDIFSGMNFLNERGIAHCDLKIDNCIYHEGRVKIIDMGLSRFCELGPDGYFFNNTAYSGSFRDPEYNPKIYNSIKVELYSIAATIYYILKNHYPENEKRNFYFGVEELTKLKIDADLVDLLMLCQEPLSRRKSISELLSHSAIIQDRLTIIPLKNLQEEYSVAKILDYQKGVNLEDFKELSYLISDFMSTCHISHKSYFLTMDIISRFISIKVLNKSELWSFAAVITYIACALCDIDIDKEYIFKSFNLGKDFRSAGLICEVCNVLEGRFFNRTLWDTVVKFEDINNFCLLVTDPNYTSNHNYVFECEGSAINRTTIYFPKMTETEIPPYTIMEYHQNPIQSIYSKPLESKILFAFDDIAFEEDYDQIINIVTSYPEYLPLLEPEIAYEVYSKLLINAKASSFELLNRLVKFDPKTVKINKDINVFTLN